MIVTLNGIEVNEGGIEGLDEIRIRYRRKDEEKKLSKGFTTELTFHGIGWELIREELIDNPAGKFNKVDVVVYDDCCDDGTGNPVLIFQGIIRGDSIDWCDGVCRVQAQLIEHTPETEKFDCIKSTLIYDNQNGFKLQNHPRVVYCTEIRPNGLMDVVMIIGIIMNITFYSLYPVILVVWSLVGVVNILITVINAIIAAVNLIPGVNIGEIGTLDLTGGADGNLLQLWGNLIDDLNLWIIGCGRKHPTAMVRSYIENVCEICGLTFSSSILNNPWSDYVNTLYFNAPIQKGTRNDFVPWLSDNDPIKTLEGLLSDISPVFNAEYRIEGDVLKFERADHFWDGDPWLHYEQLLNEGRIVEPICYSWRDEEAPAFGVFSYMEDPVDFIGNEARKRWNNIVEFNQPVSQLQSGAREVHLPFGAARFRSDGIDRDVLGDYAWWPSWSDAINDHRNALLMNNGTAVNPKLLIWDGVNAQFAEIRRDYGDIGNVPSAETFNSPFWFHTQGVTPNTAYPSGSNVRSLYARFHTFNHPKVLADRGLTFKFSLKYNCEIQQNIDLYGIAALPVGPGRVLEVELDTASRIMTVQGHV